MSQSNSCKPIRLDAPGMPLENHPMSDQDGLDICEHEAAAVAMDAHAFWENGGKPTGHRSSPIAMAAMLTSKFKDKTKLESLLAEDILRFANKIGTCHNDKLLEKLAASDKANFCEDLKLALSRLKPNPYGSGSSAGGSSLSCSLPKSDKFGGYDGVNALATLLNTQSDLKVVADEVKNVCQEHMRPTNVKQPKSLWGNQNKFTNSNELNARNIKYKQFIDASFDSAKPMPVIARYCSMFFNQDQDQQPGRHFDITTGRLGNCKDAQGFSYIHTSAVIGRRPSANGKGCEYLIKNSRGTTCNGYHKRLECDKTQGGKPCPAGAQCGGQIWVSEEELLNNTQDLLLVEAP